MKNEQSSEKRNKISKTNLDEIQIRSLFLKQN